MAANYFTRRRLLIARARNVRQDRDHLARTLIRDIQLQLLWIRQDHYGYGPDNYIETVRRYSPQVA